MDSTGSGTSAPHWASVRPCRTMISGKPLGHRATKDTPQAIGGRGPKTSRSLPGRRRAETPRKAHKVHNPGWVPPLDHTKALCDRSPRGGARAVPTPRGCKAARRNNAKRQGTLADPVAAAARRLPWRGESSSMRIWTGTTGAPATSTPSEHHLPPIPDAGPRGPASNGRTSPPFPRQSSAGGRRASRGPPPGGGRSIQLVRRLPPRVSGQPTVGGTTSHGHATKGACGGPKPCVRSGGTAPPEAPEPPSHGGHISATGARRERPKDGHRNDRDLRPSGVRWPTARRHALLGAPATGTLHRVRAWGAPWHHLTAPLPG